MHYSEVREARQKTGDRADCAVTAVALATDEPYAKVYEIMKKLGRRKNRGTPMCITHSALRALGWQATRVAWKGKTVATIKLPMGRYLVRTATHILCYKAFRVQDWTEGRRHRIQEVLHVTRIRE